MMSEYNSTWDSKFEYITGLYFKFYTSKTNEYLYMYADGNSYFQMNYDYDKSFQNCVCAVNTGNPGEFSLYVPDHGSAVYIKSKKEKIVDFSNRTYVSVDEEGYLIYNNGYEPVVFKITSDNYVIDINSGKYLSLMRTNYKTYVGFSPDQNEKLQLINIIDNKPQGWDTPQDFTK